MKQRPFALFFSSCLFLYFPFEMIWRWSIEGATLSVAEIILSAILPLILLVCLVQVTKVGWYTLIGFVSLWGVKDLQQAYLSHGASMLALFVHIAIYGVSLGYFINPRIRHLYFDPALRWWRTKPRYETHIPFLMNHHSQWHYPLMRNISEGGCFIETPHLLEISSTVQISIPLPVPLNVSVIKTEGEVRWVSTNPLRHGMGVRFLNPDGPQEKAIRQYVRKQL